MHSLTKLPRDNCMNDKTAPRIVRSPRGTELTAKSWLTEAPMRMLMNNLDPEVAERPEDLVVYGGIDKAARNWESFDKIIECLKNLNSDETLLVQSGKPVMVAKTHPDAPRVLIANSNLVPDWANWDHFNELDKLGLMMYGCQAQIQYFAVSLALVSTCCAANPLWKRQETNSRCSVHHDHVKWETPLAMMVFWPRHLGSHRQNRQCPHQAG